MAICAYEVVQYWIYTEIETYLQCEIRLQSKDLPLPCNLCYELHEKLVVPGKDNYYVTCIILFDAVLCRELYCYFFLLWNQFGSSVRTLIEVMGNLYLFCPSLEWAFRKLYFRSYCLKTAITGTDTKNKVFLSHIFYSSYFPGKLFKCKHYW